jgi:chromosome segregation ATPase
MPNYDHLGLRPSNALLSLIKEPKNSEMRDFVSQATSNNRVLRATLDLKTAKLEKKNAEVNHLLDKSKDYVRTRTDTRLDSLAYELANVKKAAVEEKMRLTQLIHDADMKVQISKSIHFASEQRIVTLKSEVDALEAKMIRLEEENKRLQTECIRHAELRMDNARLQTDHVVLQCKHEELQEKCLFLESTSALRAEQQMGNLKSENLVLQMEYETLKTENLNLKTENALLKEKNESLKLQKEVADWNLIESKRLVSQQRNDLRSLRMKVEAFEQANQARSEQMFQEGVSLETVLSNNNLQSILCPITMDLMTDPIMAEDNHTYSKAAFERHITTRRTSPLTGAVIGTSHKPNWTMKKLIEELKEIMPRVGAKTSESV